jgi:hypothetical protein
MLLVIGIATRVRLKQGLPSLSFSCKKSVLLHYWGFVPEAGIEIILTTTSNMNQVIQRMGSVVRKYATKRERLYIISLIFVFDIFH